MFSGLRARHHMQWAITALAVVIVVAVTGASTLTSNAGQDRAFFFFNNAGELARPEGYREWVYVGTPLTPNELNPPEAPFPEQGNR